MPAWRRIFGRYKGKFGGHNPRIGAPAKTGKKSLKKESFRKDLDRHPGPESWDGGREAAGEALTGVNAGQAIELRNQVSPGCRRCRPKRKATPRAVLWQAVSGRRAVVDPVHAWKLFA